MKTRTNDRTKTTTKRTRHAVNAIADRMTRGAISDAFRDLDRRCRAAAKRLAR